MATIHLSCEEATTTGLFPPFCMECGHPATTNLWRKFSDGAAHMHLPPPPEPGMGCVLFILWPLVLFLNFMAWLTSRNMKALVPLCAKHACGGWFTSSSLTAEEITPQGIKLSGVANAFVLALTRHRQGYRCEMPT